MAKKPAAKKPTAKKPTIKDSDRWGPLADKLRAAVAELNAARAQHQAAIEDVKVLLDAAEKRLSDAIDSAELKIREVSEIPPGTFPAITE